MSVKSCVTMTLLVCLAPFLNGSGLQGAAARPNVTLIYVGADDCAPCRIWGRDHLPRFTGSDAFARLTYRKVVAPTLFTLMNDAYWPQDLRDYRNKLDRRSGVPLWFVVVDERIALVAAGLHQWEDRVIPKVNSLLR